MLSGKSFEYARADQEDAESLHQTPPSLRRASIHRFFSDWTSKAALGLFLLASLIFGIVKILTLPRENPAGLLSPFSFFPDFRPILTRFQEEPDFMRWDSVGDEAWNRMIPNGAGYVRVPYPRRYDMEASVPTGFQGNDPEEAEVYQASVVHQLHCLGSLRFVLQAYRNGEKLHNKYDSDSHMAHCLNNIRQGILCASDSTLAWSTGTLMEDGFYKAKFDGVGTVHQCHNWEDTKEFLVEHRAKDWNGTIGET